MNRTNDLGQPIGEDLGGWSPPPFPDRVKASGSRVQLEPLDRQRHAAALFDALAAADPADWTYMPLGPPKEAVEIGALIDQMNDEPDMSPVAVMVDGKVVGFFALLRIQAPVGVLEIGWIMFSPQLQQTPASTEALFLAIDFAFSTGYRRVEWKCDALNARSRRTAERLGFVYEGTFRKAIHYKGRNRDTAWFALTDDDWIVSRRRLLKWLGPENFDEEGIQRVRLGDMA